MAQIAHFSISLLLLLLFSCFAQLQQICVHAFLQNLLVYAFYITGQVCDILKVPFLTCLQVTGSSFIISANIDNREAIQVHVKQPLTEGLLCYKLSRDSYYIRGYPYSLLKG